MPKKHMKNGPSWNRKSGGLKSDSSKDYYGKKIAIIT